MTPNCIPWRCNCICFKRRLGGGDTYVILGPLTAMTLVSIIPLMAAFFVAQRYFIQGIVITGIEG